MDVWSLFVTLVAIMDVAGYRSKQKRNQTELMTAILDAAAHPSMIKFKVMAIVDPNRRASAAQMLVKVCGGNGLTAPLRQTPALDDLPPKNPPVGIEAADIPVIADSLLRNRKRIMPNRTRRPPVLGAAAGEFYQTRRRTRSGAITKLNTQPHQIICHQNFVASPVTSPVDVITKM